MIQTTAARNVVTFWLGIAAANELLEQRDGGKAVRGCDVLVWQPAFHGEGISHLCQLRQIVCQQLVKKQEIPF
ncbi:MAG: hypothetical protein KDC61_02355 [Saprospiraceae bacterium]|nr:hypothetical protein [Saprospiraceae bacterium]